LPKQTAFLRVVWLPEKERTNYKGHKLGSESVRYLLNCDDRVDAGNLFLLRDSVELNFVAHLSPRRDEDDIRHEGTQEDTPLDLEPDHDRAHAVWEVVPMERLGHYVHTFSHLGNQLDHEEHAHKSSEGLESVHV